MKPFLRAPDGNCHIRCWQLKARGFGGPEESGVTLNSWLPPVNETEAWIHLKPLQFAGFERETSLMWRCQSVPRAQWNCRAVADTRVKRGWFHTVWHPTASRATPNDDALKFLNSLFLPITGCLLLEQTIRSSEARFYFRMRYVTGSTSPMKQMWRIKTPRSGRRKNMFAVTRLFAKWPKKKKKCAEMKMYYVTSSGRLWRWQCAEECGGWGIGFAWTTCAVPQGQLLNLKACCSCLFFFFFFFKPCCTRVRPIAK